MTSRVCARMAGTSEATKLQSWPSPTTSGLAFLETTSISGNFSETTASAYVPRTLRNAARTASGSLRPFSISTWIRWAKISVSVSELNLCPALDSVSFSSRWFSRMPLWTTATPPYLCGCAFSSEGLPGVADSGRARGHRLAQLLLEVGELPLGPHHREALVAEHGDAGRVIAAVFQLA